MFDSYHRRQVNDYLSFPVKDLREILNYGSDPYSRYRAAVALGKKSELTPDVTATLIAVLMNGDLIDELRLDAKELCEAYLTSNAAAITALVAAIASQEYSQTVKDTAAYTLGVLYKDRPLVVLITLDRIAVLRDGRVAVAARQLSAVLSKGK